MTSICLSWQRRPAAGTTPPPSSARPGPPQRIDLELLGVRMAHGPGPGRGPCRARFGPDRPAHCLTFRRVRQARTGPTEPATAVRMNSEARCFCRWTPPRAIHGEREYRDAAWNLAQLERLGRLPAACRRCCPGAEPVRRKTVVGKRDAPAGPPRFHHLLQVPSPTKLPRLLLLQHKTAPAATCVLVCGRHGSGDSRGERG